MPAPRNGQVRREPTRRLAHAIALPPDLQRKLRNFMGLHGLHATAVKLGTTPTAICKIDFGGKAKPDLVNRIAVALEQVSW